MTFWVSQSASNCRPILKRSVDSESTHLITSKMIHIKVTPFCQSINYNGSSNYNGSLI